jgi:hypothetical protein
LINHLHHKNQINHSSDGDLFEEDNYLNYDARDLFDEDD